jgi:hypothetical protein
MAVNRFRSKRTVNSGTDVVGGTLAAEPTILDLRASTIGGAEMSVSNRVPFRSWLVRV